MERVIRTLDLINSVDLEIMHEVVNLQLKLRMLLMRQKGVLPMCIILQ